MTTHLDRVRYQGGIILKMTDQSDKVVPLHRDQETGLLVHFDRARQELELASSIDEVKQIRDRAEALRHYARQQGLSLEMQNRCAEIKLRAERRAGEILAEMEKHPPGPSSRDRSRVEYRTPASCRSWDFQESIIAVAIYCLNT